MKWEYVTDFQKMGDGKHRKDDSGTLDHYLRHYGELGYELVNFIQPVVDGDEIFVILKRPLAE